MAALGPLKTTENATWAGERLELVRRLHNYGFAKVAVNKRVVGAVQAFEHWLAATPASAKRRFARGEAATLGTGTLSVKSPMRGWFDMPGKEVGGVRGPVTGASLNTLLKTSEKRAGLMADVASSAWRTARHVDKRKLPGPPVPRCLRWSRMLTWRATSPLSSLRAQTR